MAKKDRSLHSSYVGEVQSWPKAERDAEFRGQARLASRNAKKFQNKANKHKSKYGNKVTGAFHKSRAKHFDKKAKNLRRAAREYRSL